MKTEDLGEFTLTYDDSPEAHKRVYDMMLNWFKTVEMFHGDSIQQSDATNIDGPNLLSEVAEEGFKFHARWKETE